MSSTVPVHLTPVPGFCVKSSTLQPASYTTATSQPLPPPNSLEPPQHPITIPKGFKVFINICWDKNVPPPPEGSEDAIQRAMLGQDEDDATVDGWYVPVVVSDGRMDKDKSGNPSLVFDCVYNTSVKSRTLRDSQFKIFLVELALQRIEAQAHLLLSRQIGTPNITAKGKLEPRTVHIPTALLNPSVKQPQQEEKIKTNPLIQEIDGTSSKKDQDGGLKLRGILKNKDTKGKSKESDPPRLLNVNAKPVWTWDKQPDARLRITIRLSAITRDLIKDTALDLEPRRLTLAIPHRPTFIIDLNLSDAEIVSNSHHDTIDDHLDESMREPNRTLMLKRQKDFDVDHAEAEWRVAENVLILWC